MPRLRGRLLYCKLIAICNYMPEGERGSMAPVTPLEERLSYRCSLVSARIARFMAPMWTRYGLSVDTWRIMAVIGRYGPVSAKEVAVRSSSDAFHVSRAIDRLARKRYIKRDVDPNDRRRAKLELSASGRTAHRAIGYALTRFETELLAGLTGQDQRLLRRSLATVDERALALTASGRTWKDFA